MKVVQFGVKSSTDCKYSTLIDQRDKDKLDISDEFKNVIDTIRLYNDDKIRCVLNKADCVTREQLVRVYGSLMWSMGKIFDSPEVRPAMCGLISPKKSLWH